jgi:hypothetical protein
MADSGIAPPPNGRKISIFGRPPRVYPYLVDFFSIVDVYGRDRIGIVICGKRTAKGLIYHKTNKLSPYDPWRLIENQEGLDALEQEILGLHTIILKPHILSIKYAFPILATYKIYDALINNKSSTVVSIFTLDKQEARSLVYYNKNYMKAEKFLEAVRFKVVIKDREPTPRLATKSDDKYKVKVQNHISGGINADAVIRSFVRNRIDNGIKVDASIVAEAKAKGIVRSPFEDDMIRSVIGQEKARASMAILNEVAEEILPKVENKKGGKNVPF